MTLLDANGIPKEQTQPAAEVPQVTYDPMGIIGLELVGGLLILGDVLFVQQPDGSAYYKVTKPYEAFVLPPQGPGQQPRPALAAYGTHGGFLPSLQEVTFNVLHVLGMRDLPKGLADAYLAQASGIALSSGGLKL